MSSESSTLELSAEEWSVLHVACAGLDESSCGEIRACLIDKINLALKEDLRGETEAGKGMTEPKAGIAGATLIRKLHRASEEEIKAILQQLRESGTLA